MNEYDSERIDGILSASGYAKSNNISESDVIIFNTCCIRENADNKFLGKLGDVKPLKLLNNDIIVAVGGCIAEKEKEDIFNKASHVDLVFSNNNISNLPKLISSAKNEKKVMLEKKSDKYLYNIPSIRKYSNRALVPISIGCNNYCSFCIVPFVRGGERSIDSDTIITEVERLVNEESIVEITLLGQNVNSYGNDIYGKTKFANLLNKLNSIEGLERIRFTTSHPKDFTDEIIEAIANCDKVCEHIHLPVQSGSDNILNKMNRKYSRDEYLEKIEYIRKSMPDCSITTDIIVGFPGETDNDFKDTLDLVENVNFDSAFTFIYSPREKTSAFSLVDMVSADVKKERFQKLIDSQNKISLNINEKSIGKTYEVLVESVSKKDCRILKARNRENKIVHFKGHKSLIDSFCNVKITDAKTWYMVGNKL